jgi:uncharacterized protein
VGFVLVCRGYMPGMTEHHLLGREFPEYRDRIASLRQSNGHFRTMLEQYTLLDGEIASMDDNVTPASDETMETAKRRRMALKDELYKVLRES